MTGDVGELDKEDFKNVLEVRAAKIPHLSELQRPEKGSDGDKWRPLVNMVVDAGLAAELSAVSFELGAPSAQPPNSPSSSIGSGGSGGIFAKLPAATKLCLLNQCYEAMPTSSKMVVFDERLLLHKAFKGLIYQNTRHVMICEPVEPPTSPNQLPVAVHRAPAIVGILSVSDFIRVMLRIHRDRGDMPIASNDPAEAVAHLGTMTLGEYRELIHSEGQLKPLVSVTANQSLLEAARLLWSHHIHRLPVLDVVTGDPLFILTHKRLLRFIWVNGRSLLSNECAEKSAKQLGVGTWTGIRVVYPDTRLADCLDILVTKGVSGVPIVERQTFRILDVYSRFDAIGIALDQRPNVLDLPLSEAPQFKAKAMGAAAVVSCLDTDSLLTVIETLVDRSVHRICAVDANGVIQGLISLADIIHYLVVQPARGVNQPRLKVPKTLTVRGDLSDRELRELLDRSAKALEVEAQRLSPTTVAK